MIDSLHFVFARLLLPHLPPVTSAMFVLGVAAVEVAGFAAVTGQLQWNLQPLRRHWWFFLSVGFLVAASTALNYTSVAFIDPGTAALLAKSSVLFGLAFGIFWLGDHLTRRQILGTLLAILGVIVISFQPGDYLRLGSMLVVASTFIYALHAALVKRYAGDMQFVDFFLFRLTCTAGFLFIFTTTGGYFVWAVGRCLAVTDNGRHCRCNRQPGAILFGASKINHECPHPGFNRKPIGGHCLVFFSV